MAKIFDGKPYVGSLPVRLNDMEVASSAMQVCILHCAKAISVCLIAACAALSASASDRSAPALVYLRPETGRCRPLWGAGVRPRIENELRAWSFLAWRVEFLPLSTTNHRAP